MNTCLCVYTAHYSNRLWLCMYCTHHSHPWVTARHSDWLKSSRNNRHLIGFRSSLCLSTNQTRGVAVTATIPTTHRRCWGGTHRRTARRTTKRRAWRSWLSPKSISRGTPGKEGGGGEASTDRIVIMSSVPCRIVIIPYDYTSPRVLFQSPITPSPPPPPPHFPPRLFIPPGE